MTTGGGVGITCRLMDDVVGVRLEVRWYEVDTLGRTGPALPGLA